MELFFSPNSGEDQKKKKKGLHQKRNTFSPNSSGHRRSDAHQSQIIGEDADVHHTVLKLPGGIQPNYWGDISPPPPPGFDTPVGNERFLVAHC